MRTFFFIIFPLFIGSQASYGKLPKAAREIVEALPDNALTIELILTRGAQSAESFKEVEAQGALIPASKWAAESLYTTQFRASASHSDNQLENSSNFVPNDSSSAYKVGLARKFSSGTGLDLSLNHSDTSRNYPPTAGIPASDFYDSGVSLSLSQSLLKDSFGYSSRRNLKAARKLSEAQTHRTEAALEEWTRNISELFYAAWLSKQSLRIADDAVKRRNKLLKTTRLMAKRGTSERPDLLQVESVQLVALAQRDQASQELNNHWRNLILSLKLPAQWIQVDPRLVPIKLDKPMSAAKKQCQSFRRKGVPETESSVVRMNQALKESAQLLAESKKNGVLPELELIGSLAYNGVENTASDSISEGISSDHPAWSIGLNLTIPLSSNGEKAAYLQAYSDQIRNTATYNAAKDDLRIAWMNECSNLERLIKANSQAKKAFSMQRKREKLEGKRFRLGRIPVFNFIQSGDDAAEAERFYNLQQVLLRQSAWQVLRNASQISTIMEKLGKTYEKNN